MGLKGWQRTSYSADVAVVYSQPPSVGTPAFLLSITYNNLRYLFRWYPNPGVLANPVVVLFVVTKGESLFARLSGLTRWLFVYKT